MHAETRLTDEVWCWRRSNTSMRAREWNRSKEEKRCIIRAGVRNYGEGGEII